jgi:hypothetical protein
MTKRRTSSPYPNPPSDFVRHLTRVGWRRCDAAVRAGQALAHEPVLTGAVHRLSDGDETVSAAFRLLLAAPEEHKRALARLFHGLRRAALD